MRTRSIFTLIGFFLVSITAANATILINPPPPYPQHIMGDGSGYEIDFAGNSTSAGVVPPYNGANGQGYRFLDTTDGSVLVWFDVSSNTTTAVPAGQTMVVSITNTTNLIALTGAGVVGTGNITDSSAPPLCNASGVTTCQAGTLNGQTIANAYANYNPGSVLRISFSIASLCANSTGGSDTSLCDSNGYSTLAGETLLQSFTVNFNYVASGNPVTNVTSADTAADYTLGITDIQPTIQCPLSGLIQDEYFPGDQEIYVDPGNYVQDPGTGSGTDNNAGVTIQYLTFLAAQGGTAPQVLATGVPSGTIQGYIANGGGRQTVGPFVNATAPPPGDPAHTYTANVYAQNDAGIFSPSACTINDVQSQTISGLLTESKCFIATAAFHDGRAAPVMMLRQFRDEILSKFELGQKVIETYYTYSPALAEWAWDKPIIRSFALKALAPVELMAWAILKFSHAEQDVSPQPYIDRIKKELEAEDAKDKEPATHESYSEAAKKKLEAEPTPSGSYTEEAKKKLGEEEDSAKGYSEREKQKLPPEDVRDSPIEMVKESRDHYPVPKHPPISRAFGFKLGVSPGVKVTNTQGSPSATFNTIYGGGWQPDLLFHGEQQVFHSENFGSLALGIDFGLSYAEGFGQLAFAFGTPPTTQSQTKFSLLQVPVLVDSYYRFNLFRIVRPFIGVGVGPMLYTEIRNDQQHDKRGYSFVYTTSIGTSILLDFADKKTSSDSFLSDGIQHTYLTVDYTYLNTFEKSGILFQRGGIYAGFLFEY